jgi:hypothetical protein
MNRNKIIKKIKETYEVRFLGYAATIDLDIEIMLAENLKKIELIDDYYDNNSKINYHYRSINSLLI